MAAPEPRHLCLVNCNLYTPTGISAVKGAEMGTLLHIPGARIDIEGGYITYAGPDMGGSRDGCVVMDMEGKVVLPGFVDSHTHLPFAGTRPDEFMWRLRGESYMSIMQRGGGIASTMKAVRGASLEALADNLHNYAATLKGMGVTNFDAKSGYGLDHDAELRQLLAIKAYNNTRNAAGNTAFASSTFLGGHALPPEYAGRHEDYISFMIQEMLPEIREKGLADNCDIFCEKGVFTIEQSRRLLNAAKEMGFGVKIHADEIVWTGGAELAAEIGALSADHLLHISDAGIHALADSDTVATLLPLTAFALREKYAPARRMIDAGCAVALATDFNPGSCFCNSVPLMIALATIHMRMSLEETITALTLNGAAALGLAGECGSVEKSKRANLVVLDTDNINMLPYSTAANRVEKVCIDGKF